ncbi:AraC family transcriptional regulator [Sinorhizobium fredii]|uniref:AraC family transcriptional regulator protein n=1 Tax=Rhizobium fredii TaxID=380 RepID=A0A2L0HD82_RHIFR|nr:AraC family transcriptional regulator [Sinorhizobium fredii]AUX79404.1 AraC family transcriptional regulator protein [Sinorhizobium fredii]
MEERSPLAFDCSFISTDKFAVAISKYDGKLSISRDGTSDKVHLFLPISGSARFSCFRESIVSVPGHGTLLEGERTSSSMQFNGSRHHLALIVDRQFIRKQLAFLLDRTISGDMHFQPYVNLTEGAGSGFMNIAMEVYRGLSNDCWLQKSPISLNSLCETLGYLLIENCSHQYSDELSRPGPAPTPKHVKWAIEFMEEHMSAPISLNDIASASKVSARALQQGFKQFRNTTPMLYLRDLRMSAVHEDLLQTGEQSSVTEIARKWGFAHLGRFASDYKRRFGQLPSETANERRGVCRRPNSSQDDE